MSTPFLLAAQNTVFALVFALIVFGLTRVWRNPPVAHVLWLLVLLRLVAPPLIYLDCSALRLPGSTPAWGHGSADGSRSDGPMAVRRAAGLNFPAAR
jgi:hypothetical protein